MRSSQRERRLQIAAFLLAGLASLWVFYSIGGQELGSYSLGLGSTVFMSRGYVFFLLFWSVFGAISALFFAGAISILGQEAWASNTVRQLRATSDRNLIVALSVVGFCIPLFIRSRILLNANVADDESAYRFMSELIVSGRLYAESPPMKLFFDRAFMINDGKFYSQYFLGWPALLAPGVALGVPSLMNPLYSALTVPPIYLTLRQLGGRRCAAIGAFLFLSAPMLQFGAATMLSHTSCLFALAWASHFAVRIYLGDRQWWLHSALAASFSIAFFVRPSTALGLGLPLLGIWLVSLSSLSGKARWSAIAAFAAPALGFSAAFFLINLLQNGSPTHLAYQRAISYARENDFRFAAWNWFARDKTIAMSLGPVGVASAQTGVVLTRFNYALFGWPFAFVFLPFSGWRSQRSWIPWSMLISFGVLHFYMRNGGIDTFGPVHYLEPALPVILLTALGITRLSSWLRATRSSGRAQLVSARAPLALCLGLIMASALGYTPVRAMALHEVGLITGLPQREAEASLREPTVVFALRPFIPRECGQTSHFAFWRPNNDPDLRNPILWVNHMTVEHDKKLMELFPDRDAVVMLWSSNCTPTFRPLAEVQESEIPLTVIGGTGNLPPIEELQ